MVLSDQILVSELSTLDLKEPALHSQTPLCQVVSIFDGSNIPKTVPGHRSYIVM